MIQNNFKVLVAQKEMREKRRLTYRVIADETDLSTNTLTSYASQEVKRFDAPTLETFCKYFDCTIGDLLEYIPDPEIPPEAPETPKSDLGVSEDQ